MLPPNDLKQFTGTMANTAHTTVTPLLAPLPLDRAATSKCLIQNRIVARDLLPLLVVDPLEYVSFTESQFKQNLPVSHILTEAWHPGRLADCRVRLQQKTKPPLIDAFGYELAGQLWYTVQDGTHRTVAAREAKKRTIPAICQGYSVCQPEYFRIFHSPHTGNWSLLVIEAWTKHGQVWLTRTQQHKLSIAVVEMAMAIGILQVQTVVNFMVEVPSSC